MARWRANKIPRLWLANRNSAAARLDDLRVRDSTLPPEILLPGARQSQEVKCLAHGHARRSVPHSPTSLPGIDGSIEDRKLLQGNDGD
jgi:hypothetical protein